MHVTPRKNLRLGNFVPTGLWLRRLGSLLLSLTMLVPVSTLRAQGTSATLPGVPSLAPMLSKVTPGVVGISIAQTAEQENPLLKDPFFKKFFEDSAKNKRRAAPQPQEAEVRPSGSGVIIDAAQGLVLTNHHVIRTASRVVVVLKDRRQLPARVLGSDAGTDIALLKIEEGGVVAVPLGDSDSSQVGDYVLAIGNPFGIGQTVTSGIVSAVGRGGISPEGYEDYIQTDAAINPGNSGGALVNLRGELIGINTAILTGGEGNRGNIGIGFAVPISMAQEVVAQIRRFGEVRRGRIGVQSVDLTPQLAKEKSLRASEGALISTIETRSAAERAGLRVSDVILQLNGKPVRSAAELRNRLALVPVGDTAALQVLRGAESVHIQVVVEAVPAAASAATPPSANGPKSGGDNKPAPSSDQSWGMQLAPGADDALAVTQVDPAGRAHALGLRAGDLIVAVNRQPVANANALTYLLSQPGEKIVSVLRGGNKLRFVIPS